MEDNVTLQEAKAWHSLTTEECLNALECDGKNGLSDAEAADRLERFGPNELREEKKKPSILLFLEQFNDFMILVLIAAAVISGVLLREYLDAGVIMVIVIFNAVLGFIQEKRAENAMDELKKLSAPTVKIIRSGEESRIPAADVVPGDLMVLEAGDLISADARLVEAATLRTDEASLTGESAAATKSTEAVLDQGAALGDRYSVVHSGTHIEYGRGIAIVVATGQDTQIGRIAQMLQEAKPSPTPLQIELKDVGKRIVYICLVVALLVFVAGILRGNSLSLMFLFAVTLAVAAIPEGLPAIVTITLALGTQAMARENAIIRSLPAVETLGCANYICSDKTGTLTVNRMTVVEAMISDGKPRPLEEVSGDPEASGSEAFRLSNVTAALCCDVRSGHGGEYFGDSTEVALLEAAQGFGFDKEELEADMPRVAEIPFDSNRKMMTTIHKADGGYLVLSKGATEVILECSDTLASNGESIELSPEKRGRILEETSGLGSRALRTIGFACRRLESLPDSITPESVETGLTFMGTFSMMDPPRPEAFEALETCRHANIRVSMVTGDHLTTAEAVGRELGMLTPGMELVEGRDLDRMSTDELAERVEHIGVYARVSPHHKVKIVEALQSREYVVAMTGDGVNDAPALKTADIGVAMGITGTDVSKEASDVILADDNFASIVSAVHLGRTIFSNLKKFVYDLLTCNVSEVLTIFIAMILGMPLPLLPVQVLWINLITDGLPALSLAMEPPEKDIMNKSPRATGESILSLQKQGLLGLHGVLITCGALASFTLAHYLLGYSWNTSDGLGMCRTILFTTMVLSQVFNTYNWRSETRSFFTSPPWENRHLFGAVLLSIGLQVIVLYVPFMQRAFHAHAPSLSAWVLILICALVPVLAIDRIKVLSAWRQKRGE
ncbi:MAG: calcium-translocating P-type ATPase, PMCA-type [Actinobacteria bacterium]|nr:calcium-translocating P-type ATPase, PMCA-type [Actinomycetota bacterium]MBU4218500.1 calcium-translocating P-type ATPase, PMCA-type [Actinomycetota bacterium]MBU4358528.1 calcium-translocating P-type ATPase, PMCA-type [Actinomycetota bacterium]MBU4440858.1 calcium-translocating P-type ATPase, PMCA-type [Actinomycetota bacterium]MCG2819890.1 calcium-translocating P-type ATPase, PMCA-type [Actinomycetes bacterium]